MAPLLNMLFFRTYDDIMSQRNIRGANESDALRGLFKEFEDFIKKFDLGPSNAKGCSGLASKFL